MRIAYSDIQFETRHFFQSQETTTFSQVTSNGVQTPFAKLLGDIQTRENEGKPPIEVPQRFEAQSVEEHTAEERAQLQKERGIRLTEAVKQGRFTTLSEAINRYVSRRVSSTIAAARKTVGQAYAPLGGVPGETITCITTSQRQVEQSSFSASGEIRTADGREVVFDFDVNLHRENELTVRQTFFTDPLVINYAGQAAEFLSEFFDFDLDADGEAESIPTLAEGSAYLALDKNGDGTIEDGSELFGTSSGDGFGDLAAYDEDGNGWIDEGDSVFSKLSLWNGAAEEGESSLVSLASVEVGAFYLGSRATDFSLLKGDSHLAQVRRTGFAVKESLQAISMQQIDLNTLANRDDKAVG